ncbi:MAG: hypothetical protein AABX16_02405 [Nanoarchaeota archaeon]
MKKLMHIIGVGVLSLTAALEIYSEGEKTIIVNYPGDFADLIDHTGIYLARHIATKSHNSVTYLAITKLPSESQERHREIFVDKRNDGVLDQYEKYSLKIERGIQMRSHKIKRTDNEITQEDQKNYNNHLNKIRPINEATKKEKEENKTNN